MRRLRASHPPALTVGALAARVDWAEALFFFQLAVITGGRMAELLQMRWEESDPRFGNLRQLVSSQIERPTTRVE